MHEKLPQTKTQTKQNFIVWADSKKTPKTIYFELFEWRAIQNKTANSYVIEIVL